MSDAKIKEVRVIKAQDSKKKGFKIFLTVICSVLAAVIIAAIVLGVISYPSFATDSFADYEYVQVQSALTQESVNNVATETDANKDQFHLNALIKEGLNSTKYSYLRAFMEFNMSTSYKFVKKDVEYKDDDGNMKTKKEKVEVKGNEIIGKVSPAADAYVLTFVYKEAKEIEVEGEIVKFDRMRFLMSAREDNIIEEYTVYFYLNSGVNGATEEVQEYVTTPVLVKATGIKFVEKLNEVFEYIK